ncbi:MAG: hypothetical protein QXZ20_03880, partial [Candidatus Aenigmatarchaeota archaeon]
KTAIFRNKSLGIFSPSVWRARFSFFKSKFKKSNFSFELNLKTINTILKILVFLMILNLVSTLFISLNKLKKKLEFKIDPQKTVFNISSVNFPLKNLSYYLELARERDIFSKGRRAIIPSFQKAPSSAILEATQSLKLVGIAWSDDPDVMIEDTKTQRTYFLKRGQYLENGVKVETVFKDKVILSYKGEEIELR